MSERGVQCGELLAATDEARNVFGKIRALCGRRQHPSEAPTGERIILMLAPEAQVPWEPCSAIGQCAKPERNLDGPPGRHGGAAGGGGFSLQHWQRRANPRTVYGGQNS